MLKKYNLIVLKALLCVAPLAITGKIVAMDREGPERVKDITYQDKKERAGHLERMQDLQNLFAFNNLGRKIFCKENIIDHKLSPDGQFLFIKHRNDIHNNHSAELINTQNGTRIGNQLTNVSYFTFSPNSQFLFIMHGDDTAELISTENGSKIGDKFTSVYLDGCQACTFSPDSKLMFIKHKDNTAELINASNGLPICYKFTNFYQCKFSPNSKFVFVNFIENLGFTAKLINTEDGKQIGDQFTNAFPCTFNPNSKFLSIRHNNNTVELINTANGLPVQNQPKNVFKYFFSHSGKLALIAYFGCTAELINMESGNKSVRNLQIFFLHASSALMTSLHG